jgi:hypothetical protein
VLHEFVTANRDEIIQRCRKRVAARQAPLATRAEIDHGVPIFLDQLVNELRSGPTPNPEITATAIQHGRDVLRQGYTVSQLVHDYGDVCQSVTELAIERDARISADDFRALNRCLDDAIAGSVTEYSNLQIESSAVGVARDGERIAALARGVRVDLEAASVAFETMVSGPVGLNGGTAKLLADSLRSAAKRNDSVLAEVDTANEAIRRSKLIAL